MKKVLNHYEFRVAAEGLGSFGIWINAHTQQEAEQAARRYCGKQGITYRGRGFCPDHLCGGAEDAV